MDYNKILEDLNNYDTDFDNYRIPMDVENRKELLYILEWRKGSNDGGLCGPDSIEVAKKAIELEESGEIPVDFDFVKYSHFFVTFVGAESSVADFESRAEYYRKCDAIARKYGMTLQKININIHNYDVDSIRDLENYTTNAFEKYCESTFEKLF